MLLISLEFHNLQLEHSSKGLVLAVFVIVSAFPSTLSVQFFLGFFIAFYSLPLNYLKQVISFVQANTWCTLLPQSPIYVGCLTTMLTTVSLPTVHSSAFVNIENPYSQTLTKITHIHIPSQVIFISSLGKLSLSVYICLSLK